MLSKPLHFLQPAPVPVPPLCGIAWLHRVPWHTVLACCSVRQSLLLATYRELFWGAVPHHHCLQLTGSS
jgi:hypothetical protein